MTKKSHAQEVLEGIEILQKFDSSIEIVAEHDMIYVRGDYDLDLFSNRDQEMLEAIGWFVYEWDDNPEGHAWAKICV